MSCPIVSGTQTLTAPATKEATILVLRINVADHQAVETIHTVLSQLDDTVRSITTRDSSTTLSCTVGFGSDAWDLLMAGQPRPKELHPFQEIKGDKHTAVSTKGDLMFHMRANRRDLCFELELQVMRSLGTAVILVDVRYGFRYFNSRNALKFIDGTANPTGPDVPAAVLITAEDDPPSAGGCYIVLQRYVHDLPTWDRISTEQQEKAIGRTKMDNIELKDAGPNEQKSHRQLTSIEGKNILRDNMPYGSPSEGVVGTYFIAYTAVLQVVEQMLENMFIGQPRGMYDPILDVSKPVSGLVFFAPQKLGPFAPSNVLTESKHPHGHGGHGKRDC